MERKDDHEYFTVVFKGDLRKFPGNPLTTETPFGIPYSVSLGDALERIDDMESKDDAHNYILDVPWHEI